MKRIVKACFASFLFNHWLITYIAIIVLMCCFLLFIVNERVKVSY